LRGSHLDQHGNGCDQQRIVGERREELRRHDRVEPALHRDVSLSMPERVSGLPDDGRTCGSVIPCGEQPTDIMSRPITATISIAALRHNLARVRELAPAARIWAVVKANAYGHGIAPAMTAF